MRPVFCALAVGLLLATVGACEINPAGFGSVHNECQSRGHTRGTKAYNRCVRDLEGRLFLKDFERGR